MIVRDFDVTRAGPSDPVLRAGWEGERQMAFYLRRAFESDPDARVFNGLRFEAGSHESGFTQIDHLVLHRWGAVVIESKAVHGELHVDRLGQWQRVYPKSRHNIPSPIEQARRQAEALRRLLISHKRELLDRFLLGMLQKGFKFFPIRFLVAIGDRGRFVGATQHLETEVMKAERIAEQVAAEIERHRRAAGLAGVISTITKPQVDDAGNWSMSAEELDRVASFLNGLDSEPPEAKAHGQPAPEGATRADAEVRLERFICGKCRGLNVGVVQARYGYCVRCGECGGFTPIDFACRACGVKARLRKDGPAIRRDCPPPPAGCGRSIVFWRDGAPE